MQKPFLIALCGPIGAGKDTVADYLSDKYGYTKVGFSDPVYQALWALNPVVNLTDGTYRRLQDVVMDMGWETAKRSIPEIRRLLRHVGTEAGRDIHGEDCWVRRMEQTHMPQYYAMNPDRKPPEAKSIVIRDLRFENELRLVRNYRGQVWFVNNGTYDSTKEPEHRSESLRFDMIYNKYILNTGTLEQLYRTVDSLLFQESQ